MDARLKVLLCEMKDAATDASYFTAGMAIDDFLADGMTQSAVAMSLVRLGEAATKILQAHGEFAREHPQHRWESMRGVRNIIAHAYGDIDFVILWEIVEKHLPPLLGWFDEVLADRR